MSATVRILLLADSHLGLGLPARPRTARRPRGQDFLDNYGAALAPAFGGEVDVVVHAGDVFDRSQPGRELAYRALEPLRRVAERGVPVLVVPGNHERSVVPHRHLLSHPGVHVFDRARTFVLNVAGVRIACAGFPYERRSVRTAFPGLLQRSEWVRAPADLRLLCIHHCVEGATVGPGEFTFTTAADVIRAEDIPLEFGAVFSGHIHRHQVLTRDLRRRPLAAPVLYPGSIERTSLAEIGEPKGFLIVHVDMGAQRPAVRWEFRQLPARPMVVRDVVVRGLSARAIDAAVRAIVSSVPVDALLRIRINGAVPESALPMLSAAHLRTYVPATMNVGIRPVNGFARVTRSREPATVSPQVAAVTAQLELGC